jgi:hypothetical protein
LGLAMPHPDRWVMKPAAGVQHAVKSPGYLPERVVPLTAAVSRRDRNGKGRCHDNQHDAQNQASHRAALRRVKLHVSRFKLEEARSLCNLKRET